MITNDLLDMVNDPKTAPETLRQLYNSHNNKLVIECIGLNPNTPLSTIEQIFKYEVGMADKILAGNIAISLLVLENTNLIKDWIREAPHDIFNMCDNKSIQLQEIAYDTQNSQVLIELTASRYVSKEIINKVECGIINGIFNDYTLVKNIAGSPYTSLKFIVHILKNANSYGVNIFAILHKNVRNNERLQQELSQRQSVKQRLPNYKEKDIDLLKKYIRHVENLLYADKIECDLIGEEYTESFDINGVFIETNVQNADVVKVSCNNETVFAYYKGAPPELIYIGNISKENLDKIESEIVTHYDWMMQGIVTN